MTGDRLPPLDTEYATLLGVRPDANCSELAAAAVRLGGFQAPVREQTVLLLARCIRKLQELWRLPDRPGPMLMEALATTALDPPDIRAGMDLDALLACAIDLGVIDASDASPAGYVDAEFGPTVPALNDSLDHLAQEIGYLIAMVDEPPIPPGVQEIEPLFLDDD